MQSKLREAWKTHIRAQDYEAHMATVGQAEANAQLVREYFKRGTLPDGSKVLFAGAGTGQMFEYVAPKFLEAFELTFSDINRNYLDLLESRLRPNGALRFRVIEDDIEATELQGRFDAAISVLLLEHVDWRKGVATLCSLVAAEILVVVQQNPVQLSTAMTPGREVAGTMAIFREVHPELIAEPALVAEFARHGLQLDHRAERLVADEKKMVGLTFRRPKAKTQ